MERIGWSRCAHREHPHGASIYGAAKSWTRLLAFICARERDDPAPPAPLDLDWQLLAACSELEIEESDPLFFAGQGQTG